VASAHRGARGTPLRRGALLKPLLAWTVAFVLVVVAVLNAALWFSFRRFSQDLDRQLGERLKTLAVTAASSLEPEDVESTFSAPADALAPAAPLSAYLDRVLEENGLSNVAVIRNDETTVADLRGLSSPGERNPLLDLDLVAVTSALAGVPTYGRQYKVEGNYLKSAYAPLHNTRSEVVGALAVEAGASWFDSIREVRRNLLLAAGLSLVAVALVAGGFVQAASRLTRLEESLRRSENLATMGQMAAMLAHEIRNPLGIIKGAAERLRDRYDLADDELYRFIPEEVDRLNGILGQYLRFARGDRDQAGIYRPDQVVESTVALVAHDLEQKGTRLAVEIDEESRRAYHGDAQGLRQALLNLVLNAAQSLDSGGDVKIAALSRDGRLLFRVEDSGPGIPPDVLRRLGEPFFTTRATGSGLGLAIVNRVAETEGGRLLVSTDPGKGSVFTLDLPARPVPLENGA
jgi:signal transduction histidine kinase